MQLLAPAKINFFLHITGKRNDGYHLLDSLVAFTDFGDEIEIKEANEFSFSINGDFGDALSADDNNLVIRAAKGLAEHNGRTPNVAIHLTKRLPIGGGVGGGSSDAAAVVRGLCKLWDIAPDSDFMDTLLLSLGADVPVCFNGQTARIQGIGEVIDTDYKIPPVTILLIAPNVSCSTPEIFRSFSGKYRDPIHVPQRFESTDDFVSFLKLCRNDLQKPAISIVPEIADCIEFLNQSTGCLFSQMSGSGSCSFGLFSDEAAAIKAEEQISINHPNWWARRGIIS